MTNPEVVELDGQERETGRKAADALRDAKRVPAVLYGPEVDDNIHLSIDELELEDILSESSRQFINISVNGETHKTLLKDIDFHPITDRPTHVDFYEVADDRKVTLTVPIKLEGTPVGVTEGGGRIFQPRYILKIRVTPDRIPGEYAIDISELEIGDSLHVRDLDLEGIIPLDDLSETLVTIRPPKSEAVLTSSLLTEEPAEEELEEDEEALEEGEVAEGEEVEEEGEDEEESTE